MGIIELLIVVLLLAWLFGYFGRGRWYGSRGTGPAVAAPAFGSGNLLHILLVIVVVLVILRLLGLG